MRLRRLFPLAGALVLLVLSCGTPKSFSVKSERPTGIQVRTYVNPIAAASKAIEARRVAEREFLEAMVWLDAIHDEEQPSPATEPRSVTVPTTAVTVASSLPPDWVIQRESGGDYNAYNPTGCADFCYGRYQFSSDWGGKLGLPEDIRQATPEQQDEAARQLWDNGAGCSHWSACN